MQRFYSHMIVPYMNLPGKALYQFKLKGKVVKQVNGHISLLTTLLRKSFYVIKLIINQCKHANDVISHLTTIITPYEFKDIKLLLPYDDLRIDRAETTLLPKRTSFKFKEGGDVIKGLSICMCSCCACSTFL